MATISVLDANGDPQDVELPNADGRQAAAASRPVALATEDLAAINAITTALADNATGADIASVVTALGTLPTGAATSAKQDTLIGHVDGIETLLGGTLAVSGTFFQATQPVSIAAPVAVTGTFWQATQPVSAASLPLPTGAATEATLADVATGDDIAAVTSAVSGLTGSEYETVAASQSDQALGATGATGDLLVSLLVVPATTSPGAVSIKDGAGSAITVFPGGAASVSTLHPFSVPLGIRSAAGAWQVTTGANVSVIASGSFT